MDEFAFAQQRPLSSSACETQKVFETGPARKGVTETSAAMPGLGKEGDKARAGVAITVPEQDQQILCQNSPCMSRAGIHSLSFSLQTSSLHFKAGAEEAPSAAAGGFQMR